MMLVFDPQKVPRTTTRAQWREIDRWLRVTRAQLETRTNAVGRRLTVMMQNFGAYGTTHPER